MTTRGILFSVCCLMGLLVSGISQAQTIRIGTRETDLILQVSPQGRLYQVYLGERLLHEADVERFFWPVYAASDASVSERGHEVCAVSGGEDFFEPALAITHADGNQTSYLYYAGHEQRAVKGGTETVIRLRDNKYPVDVTLHYVAYTEENVIKTWSEVVHHEKRPVTLWRFGSTILYLEAQKYYLTNYSSDWAREGQPNTQQLMAGKKVVDTKLGTRAAMYAEPFFELGLGSPATEESGRVLLGAVGWTGNFSLTFEVDNVGTLRLVPAINAYASNYRLAAGEVFSTPEFLFTISSHGIGAASRNLHDWARRFQLKEGEADRMTQLNNWESTAFDFDQAQLEGLMRDARELGVDMFLLDDGWFGNSHPRNNDNAGLGDWEANTAKLPDGLLRLTHAADSAGVKFGLWIEPEMVNPRSRLFEQHPDWAITLPNRDTYYYRNQLVLDLCNPKVQDYVFSIIDRLLTENPGIAYFKWDCNSPITNIHSPYLAERQGNLYIDYVRGLYSVIRRVAEKYPRLPMMLCAGGGARCDYEALKYFTEFWCSDNTDPYERLYMQWSLSRFFPVKAMASHVTNWNRSACLKFRTDVASMCRLGFDIDLQALSPDERLFLQQAVANYRQLKSVILDGTLYRLVSPYEGQHMAVDYVSQDKGQAVLFAYDLHPRYKELVARVRLQGLDASRSYTVREINLLPGQQSQSPHDGQTYSGDYLMKAGLQVFSLVEGQSHVLYLQSD